MAKQMKRATRDKEGARRNINIHIDPQYVTRSSNALTNNNMHTHPRLLSVQGTNTMKGKHTSFIAISRIRKKISENFKYLGLSLACGRTVFMFDSSIPRVTHKLFSRCS